MKGINFYKLGRKSIFSFLLLLVLPVFSEGKEKDKELFKVYQEKGKIIWELSETLIGREWLLINQLVAVSSKATGQPGDMVGEPRIMQLREKVDGRFALVFKGVMSKNAGSNMVGPPKPPREIAYFSRGTSSGNGRVCLDVTSWVLSDTGMVKGELLVPTLKMISHSESIEIVSWRDRKRGGRVQVSSCLLLMAEDLMRLRHEDQRVGYFRNKHAVLGDTAAREDDFYCISRWRLEPRPEDVKKYQKGVLVEPQNPILFYIDPLTPAKWVPYIKKAINDWNTAFKQAGFKNAIQAKVGETSDSSWTLASCRAAIVYRPTIDENAFGERYADPRSGQIYHARIMWGHSLVEWLKGNYILQAGPSDPAVFTKGISDEWLGTLLGVIVSHEVGHTLGLTHNMGASSLIPVEKLRDNKWLTRNGISVSLMDYSRFNYVAQPGDKIERLNLIPRINVYDRWAIEWGYRLFPKMKTLEEERVYLSAWIGEEQKKWGQWYGSQSNTSDPRCQSEDVGDDLVTANTYGMENLKWVLEQIDQWEPDRNGSYTTYQNVYNRIVSMGERNVPLGQYYYYLKQIVNIVGGNYVNYDERERLVTIPVEVDYQRRAMMFLGKYVFTTPEWLVEPMLSGKVKSDPIRFMRQIHTAILMLLLPKANVLPVKKFAGRYTLNDFFEDLDQIIWQDVSAGEMPNVYRQNLQRTFLGQIRTYGSRGGPEAMKLYRYYLVTLKERVEQASRKNQEEEFSIYCRDVVREINRFLK